MRQIYGNIELSVQKSKYHNCGQGTAEIALIPVDGSEWLMPSDIGLPEYDKYWSRNGRTAVGNYVPTSAISKIRTRLKLITGE